MNFIHSLFTLILFILAIYNTYLPLSNIIMKINTGKNFNIKNKLINRLRLVIEMVFLQKKLFQDKIYGFMHFWFLYGFSYT